jgi:hypothetical protein
MYHQLACAHKVYTVCQFLREDSVTTNTFLCFIKKLFGDQVSAYIAIIRPCKNMN